MSKNAPAVDPALYCYKKPFARLHIDVESYSATDLIKCGSYRYWEDPEAAIMLFGYAFDDDPITVIDLMDFESVPQMVLDALIDPYFVKIAYNANFERNAIREHFGIYCDPEQWRDTMILGMSLGLPGRLAQQCKALDMPVKKAEGKNYIKLFCVPCKPTKKNGMRTRNLPHHFPEDWEGFKGYNKTDVEAERALWLRLQKYDMQPRQWKAWAMDQRINDRGVRVDEVLIDEAIKMNDIIRERLTAEAIKLTGLENPNSVKQLIKWFNDAEKEEDEALAKHASDDWSLDKTLDDEKYILDLRKKTVIELLERDDLPDVMRRMLELRQLMAKSSVTKYRAMKRSVCADGRIRGLLQFYGAPRTGRWAGRIVQVQNLPQNHLKDIALCREIVRRGDLATLEMLFGEGILSVLSELIRTAFIPAEGKRFVIVDFSAIEARLQAWDSEEEWRMEVFRTHGLIYEASAEQMFGVPLDLIKKGGTREDLRPKGKVTELALGYQGGPNALVTMGALEMGIPEPELLPTVRVWRRKSPKLARCWYDTNDDAIDAIKRKTTIKRYGVAYNAGKLRYGFEFKNNSLFQLLPSGRKLCYPNARLEWDEKYEKDAIVFDGINQYTHQWGPIRTYGGKLFENRTQANGVDNLTNAMFALEEDESNCLDIVFSVHDEPVLEVPIDWMSERAFPEKPKDKKSKGVVYIESILCRPQKGFDGLPLRADGMDATFYQK